MRMLEGIVSYLRDKHESPRKDSSLLDGLLDAADGLIASNDLMQAEMVLKRCYDIAPERSDVTSRLFAGYQKNLHALKKSRYMDFPLFVSLETQTICNASCSFCPYPSLERLGNKMSDGLIDKVISDLKEIPSNVPFRFAPFKVSDPFTEPRLFKIIDKINTLLPNASIDIYTNGVALTPARLDQLCQIKNFQFLNVSLNEHRKDEYENLMGLKFDHTISRLTHLHDRAAKGELPFPVVVSRVCDYIHDEAFRAWVAEKFPCFQVHTHRRSDWIGQVEVGSQKVPDIGCAMWFSLSITSTGSVAYCCMDGTGEFPIGDISKQHTLDVYNTPGFRKMREQAWTRKGSSPCGQCTFF